MWIFFNSLYPRKNYKTLKCIFFNFRWKLSMPPWNATIRRPWSAGSTRPTKPTPGSISVKKRSKRHAGTSWRVENFWRQFVLNRVTVLVQKEIAHSIFWSFHSKDVNIFFYRQPKMYPANSWQLGPARTITPLTASRSASKESLKSVRNVVLIKSESTAMTSPKTSKFWQSIHYHRNFKDSIQRFYHLVSTRSALFNASL